MKINFCTAHLRPTADTLELLGGKWKLLILSILRTESPLRFGELERALETITPRMLSKELKELEQNELIERRVYPTMPVTVEYALTEYGRTLEPVLVALSNWGKSHRRRIMNEGQPVEPQADASVPTGL